VYDVDKIITSFRSRFAELSLQATERTDPQVSDLNGQSSPVQLLAKLKEIALILSKNGERFENSVDVEKAFDIYGRVPLQNKAANLQEEIQTRMKMLKEALEVINLEIYKQLDADLEVICRNLFHRVERKIKNESFQTFYFCFKNR
jgi:hypothetical protein